jgi:hypothetical protein
VDEKLAEGAIFIGPPKTKANERLSVNREEGRYMVTVEDTPE